MNKRNRVYQSLRVSPLPVEAEGGFLTSSAVEIEESVTVEPFKDGFSDMEDPSEGFVVNFE